MPEKADGGTKEGGGIPRDSEREEVDENFPPDAAWNLILYCACIVSLRDDSLSPLGPVVLTWGIIEGEDEEEDNIFLRK